jgi:hypothetical protein
MNEPAMPLHDANKRRLADLLDPDVGCRAASTRQLLGCAWRRRLFSLPT